MLSPRDAALARLKQIVLDAVPSQESKRAYGQALDDFLGWCNSAGVGAFTKTAVNAYRSSLEARNLSPSTINQRLSAIRKLAVEAADNGLIPPELASSISRVKGAKQAGVRTGHWLTREQAEKILSAPDVHTTKGRRDLALLAVLIGCGLRRKEAATLTFDHIQLRDARWVIVDLAGKGGRIRSVPMPVWAKLAIDTWTAAAAINDGFVFRGVTKRGEAMASQITPRTIFEVVHGYGDEIGVSKLAPHDLRRTFAKLAHQGRAGLEQIQLSLGHASITTTERYLGVRQDFADAPCDHLGLAVEVTK